MMREKTKTKYTNAIYEIKKQQIRVHYKEFTAFSRKWFDNFVTMHYLKRAGCLNQIGQDHFMIDTAMPTSKIVAAYEKLQEDSGKKAMKRFRENRKRFSVAEKLNGHINTELPDLENTETLAKDMVNKLRSWGYDVTCKKIMEL